MFIYVDSVNLIPFVLTCSFLLALFRPNEIATQMNMDCVTELASQTEFIFYREKDMVLFWCGVLPTTPTTTFCQCPRTAAFPSTSSSDSPTIVMLLATKVLQIFHRLLFLNELKVLVFFSRNTFRKYTQFFLRDNWLGLVGVHLVPL